MKTIIINSLKSLIADRYLLVLLSIFVIISIVVITMTGLSIQPSERQLISHYSTFGIRHLYLDQWSYRLSFVFFEIIVLISHVIISIKLLTIKGHPMAIMYAWFGIGIMLLGLAMSNAILSLRV